MSSYLPRARALARAQFPDAVLLRFDAQGVRPSGRADLTLDSRFSVLYRFVSPSHVGRPHNLPAGVSHRGTCIYYVVVEKDSVSTYPLTNWPCDHQPSVRRPRCTLKQVWQKAAGKGAPTHNAVAEIDYRLGPDGQPHWWFQIGKDYQYTFDDDC